MRRLIDAKTSTWLLLVAPVCLVVACNLNGPFDYADSGTDAAMEDLRSEPDGRSTGGRPPTGGRSGESWPCHTGDGGLVEDEGASCDGGAPPVRPAPPAATYAVTSKGRLVQLDLRSGDLRGSIKLAGLREDALLGADFRPADRALYVLGASGALYVVDVATGTATFRSMLSADPADGTEPFAGLSGMAFGVDFNPVADRLRVVSNTGQNLRINVDNGLTTTDGMLNPGTPYITAAAYANSFAETCRTQLYVIEPRAKKLFLQNPPNAGTLVEIGDLGVEPTAFDSVTIDIQTTSDGENTGFALMAVGGATAIYDIDLQTGAATNPRAVPLDDGETVLGASATPPILSPPQAPGELLGLTESDQLISFNRGAPGRLCTKGPIAGMQPGERVLGIDIRPTDGALYAVGSAGTIYTLDVPSGMATRKAILMADPADMTDPFTGLMGEDFGIGFNPVPDRLRVVGDGGQNLRINVDTGATITDSPLSPAPATVSAVSYTNSFAGTKSTTLFAIDSSADMLVRIGADPATGGACPDDPANPNCGVVTPIGALNAGDVSGVNGFDIDGTTGVLGTALLAFSSGGDTTSSLYAVDLGTGTAAPSPGVANPTIGGGERLRGLSFATNPVVTAFAATYDNRLLTFAPSAPSMPTRDVAIAGLDYDEALVGIDVRPADGGLYGVSSQGRLFRVDPSTGMATLIAPLQAAIGDDDPLLYFDPILSYGMDFNPTVDAIRLVSDIGQNLRILPADRPVGMPPVDQAAGAVFTDAELSLNQGSPAVLASAYTNSFRGATVTTLFGLDVQAGTLVRQGGPNGDPSPNGGVLAAIGPLGIDGLNEAHLDIAGGHNGLALAALRTTGDASALYAINLTTGAAAPYNTADGRSNVIGSADRAPISGLAVLVQ